eukprot:Colp12_sorted_trinity150504_noHs@2253
MPTVSKCVQVMHGAPWRGVNVKEKVAQIDGYIQLLSNNPTPLPALADKRHAKAPANSNGCLSRQWSLEDAWSHVLKEQRKREQDQKERARKIIEEEEERLRKLKEEKEKQVEVITVENVEENEFSEDESGMYDGMERLFETEVSEMKEDEDEEKALCVTNEESFRNGDSEEKYVEIIDVEKAGQKFLEDFEKKGGDAEMMAKMEEDFQLEKMHTDEELSEYVLQPYKKMEAQAQRERENIRALMISARKEEEEGSRWGSVCLFLSMLMTLFVYMFMPVVTSRRRPCVENDWLEWGVCEEEEEFEECGEWDEDE